MSKPKKGNKNHQNKGYSFNEALLQYNVKNYTGTLMRLKAANLKPNEVERAEQLKQATLLRLVYNDFSTYQYDQALQRLQLLPADNLIAHALTGITYLYQNDFLKAAPVFKNLIQQADYQNFTVYYLLAELYIGQPEKYDDFKNWHAALFAQCTAFQQDYLHIAFYIVQQQFDHALNLIKFTKGASHAQHSHIEALKQVLTLSQGKNEGQVAPTTKALYRLLLNHPLQDFEATYFSAKQSESPLFVDIFKQQSSLTPELIQELKKLCETDKLVNEGVLARLIKAVPEGYRPYIAYNQAVNALNDNDFTTSERGVKHIIVTYPQYLVQVPESLTLYLNFHLIDDIKVYPNTFWQFFNQWLAIHKTRISTENLDALGWLLFDIVLANPELVRMSHSHALINLYKAHPSMFSTKFTYICFSTFTEKPNIAFDAGALDLFSLPNAEKNKEKFVETLDKMIGGLIAASQRSFFGESIPMSVITNQVEQLSKAFIQAVNTHETPPKNTIALEAFKVVNKYIQEYSHQFTSRTTFLDAFTKAYTQLLETFPNNKTKEVYSQDLSTLTNMSFTVPFKKLIEHGASLREFQAFFKKNPPPATYGFAWGAICNQISKSHFEADEIPTIVDFIKYLSFKLDRMEVLISEIKHFVEQYKNMSQKHNCEHPTVFYAQLLSALFKERAFAPIMVYTFVKEYGLTFTEQYAFEPKNYNAIGDFLEWLSKQSKSAINYDKDFISHLVSHLEEINKLKNLKKLGATLVKARALIA